VIKPPKKDSVGVEQSLAAEISRADSVSPGYVNPWPGDQVLVFPRAIGGRMLRKREKPVDTSMREHVIPSGDVQRWNPDFVDRMADIQGRPILSWLIVVEPIEYIGRHVFALNRRMRAEGKYACFAPRDWPRPLRDGRLPLEVSAV